MAELPIAFQKPNVVRKRRAGWGTVRRQLVFSAGAEVDGAVGQRDLPGARHGTFAPNVLVSGGSRIPEAETFSHITLPLNRSYPATTSFPSASGNGANGGISRLQSASL